MICETGSLRHAVAQKRSVKKNIYSLSGWRPYSLELCVSRFDDVDSRGVEQMQRSQLDASVDPIGSFPLSGRRIQKELVN